MSAWLRGLIVRLRAVLSPGAARADLDEELRYHLEREAERHIAQGVPPADAAQVSRRRFGNVSVIREQARDAWTFQWLEFLGQDVRYAFRTFVRAPTFAVTVIATIGLGLGLLASVFTLFDAYVLRPIAIRDPGSVYEITWHSLDGRWHAFSWPQFQQLDGAPGMLDGADAYNRIEVRFRDTRLLGDAVSGGYFEHLGILPSLGRPLLPADASTPGEGSVVVLSHATWQSAFGGDSAIVGRMVRLNGRALEVVGVTRPGFQGLTSTPVDFWVPITIVAALGGSDPFAPLHPEVLRVVGRVRRGVSVAQAQAGIIAWLRVLTADRPALQQPRNVDVVPRGTPQPMVPELWAVIGPIAVAFLLVMLVACANVANMMLARGLARRREIGIRLAIGASRPRLIRQLLTECVILSILAAALAFDVSRVALQASVRLMYATLPPAYVPYVRVVELSPDARVLIFTLAAALGAAILFGLVPALQATRPSVVHATRGDFDTPRRQARLRSGLVVAQVATSILLLVCAGVLLRASQRMQTLNPGIRTQHIVQLELLDSARTRVVRQLQADPTVAMLASSRHAPLDGRFDQVSVGASADSTAPTDYNIVSPEYFQVLNIRIVHGRGFTDQEGREQQPVAVVSETAAKRFWPGRNAVGQELRLSSSLLDNPRLPLSRSATVVGVVRDVTPGSLLRTPQTPVVYYPQPVERARSTVLALVSGAADRARDQLAARIAVNDSAALQGAHTLEESLAVQAYPFLAANWVASVIGLIALLMTVSGVYGVLAYVVAQRTREFGIRIALGASRAGMIGAVLHELLRLALIGLVIGGALALALSRLLAATLVMINPSDPIGFAIGIGAVLLACLAAAYVPSRRAAIIDPVQALRTE